MRYGFFLVIVLAAMALADGPATRPASGPASGPAEVVEALLNAQYAGVPQDVAPNCQANPETKQTVQDLIDMAGAIKDLHQTVREKFGDSAVATVTIMPSPTSVRDAIITIDGDWATVKTTAFGTFGLMKVDGAWKVDIADHLTAVRMTAEANHQLLTRSLADVIKTREDIIAGRITDVAGVRNALLRAGTAHPAEVLKTLVSALNKGLPEDVAGNCQAKTPQTQLVVKDMTDVATAIAEIHKVAAAKFGDAGLAASTPKMTTPEAVDKADESIDGDTALVRGEGLGSVPLVRVGNVWKVDIDGMIKDAGMSPEEADEMFSNLSKAVKQATADINSGKITDVDSMREALSGDQLMHDAAPATQPGGH